MVSGIESFRDHFKDYLDRFVIVGGVACSIIHERAGLEFRTTKDFDIVVLIDKVDREFSEVFMKFIEVGEYSNIEKSTGKSRFYRFYNPVSDKFPYMLELFSKKPEVLDIDTVAGKIVRVADDSEILSLSAILMLDEYYDIIRENIVEVFGLPVVNEKVLIPLKARAYLDLLKRKKRGDRVDSRDIKKHKNDVFRLFSLVIPWTRLELNKGIKRDMSEFIENVIADNLDLKTLGIKTQKLSEVIEIFKTVYGI